MKGTIEEWDKVKNKDINLIVTEEERKRILEKIGYGIDNEGFLIDSKTKERIKAEDGLEINIKEDKKLALISGSHNFVRNVAGFSQLLAEKNALNFKTIEKK